MKQELGLYITFLLYILFILGVGIYFYKKSKGTLATYFLADRNVNPYVTALSAQASDMSAWLFMSLPAAAYLFGYQAAWIAIGLFIGTVANWELIAKRMRNFSYIFGESITVPQYIENRFGGKSPILRLVCAIIILFFFLLYVASGYSAEAKLFEEVFGIDYQTGLFLGATIILFYTFIGGFLAVCWTDFYQGILMFATLIAVALILYTQITATEVKEITSATFVTKSLFSNDISWGTILSGLSWGLGYFGMPHIIVRFMSIRSSREVRTSKRIAYIWVGISLLAAIAIGILGKPYLIGEGITYVNQTQAEKLFIYLSTTLFNPWISGILISAILAAIMSTISSQLLVMGSAMVSDIYSHINSKSGNQENMLLSRMSIILITLLALVIAWNPNNSVMSFVSYAWSGFAATFAPVILLSLHWRRMTMRGAISGLIVGAIAVITWESLSMEAHTELSATLPSFALSSATIIIASLLDKRPTSEIIDKFNQSAIASK
ncbi:MAG: sodium/proline symporter PutP [Bacteroidales bacterium]